MKSTVYKSLRDEMTAYFTALRNLELGQYGIIVVVFTVLMNHSSMAILTFQSMAIIGFIFMATKIGKELHNESTRIGSYIMVAYKVKTLHESKEDEDRFQYWILANRSSSLRGLKESEKDRFGFRRNLAKFFIRQVLAIFIFTLLISLSLIQVYLKTSKISTFDFVAIVLFVLLVLTCIWSIYKDAKVSKDYGKNQVRNWRDYCKKRNVFDAHFLQEVLGDDQGAKKKEKEN